MAYSRPKQSLEKLEQFRRKVEDRLEAMGKNHAWLAEETGYRESTISRLLDFSRPYNMTERLFGCVCIAVGLSAEETWEWFCLLFPEDVIIIDSIAKGASIKQTNAALKSNGLPPLNSQNN